MSTKTTLKRIALVAVSALGFGVMSAVAPAFAGDVYTTSISATTNRAPVAGLLGSAVTHTVRFQSATTQAVELQPRVALSSRPATSALALQAEGNTTVTPLAKAEFDNGATPATDASVDFTVADSNVNFGSETGYSLFTYRAYLHVHYDVPGTYVWTIWDDNDTQNSLINGSEVSTTFTVVVSGTGATQTYTATTTTFGSSTATGTSITNNNSGSLVRITLNDSAGNPASPDATGGVRVAVSGSALIAGVNDDFTIPDATSYVLGSGDFNGSGQAWINVVNATAESVSLTLSGSGSMANSFTAPAAVVLTFAAAVPSDPNPAFSLGALTGLKVTTPMTATADGVATANRATGAITFQTGKSAATPAKKDKVGVVDTSGRVTGLAGAQYTLLVTEGDSDTCTYCGTFSVTPSWGSLSDQSFSLFNAGGFALVVTSAAAAADSIAVQNQDVIRAATGATVSFTVLVKNQFGVARSGQAVTATISGRNSTVSVASAITDANGFATLSYKDASTSTTSLTDVITFTATTGVTDTAQVTFTSVAGFGVSSVLLTTPHTTSTGVTEAIASYSDIDAGADGAQAKTINVTATVKDAAGTVLAGIPVTFSVDKTGAAVTSNTVTVYTGTTGLATAKVYGWLAGTYTITATAGGVADTAPVNFAQTTADGTEARNITATVSGSTVVATVTDRFGNPVFDAPVRATRTGAGSFNGVSTASGDTGRDGKIEFVISGGDAEVTVYVGSTENYGQTAAAAGLVSSATATDTFEDYVAGTAVSAEEGVGNNVAAYTKAGNNSAKVSVTGVNSVIESAADAALEAIDAANAATDAANLAAEAADAATVAAEEARDAADAATAAVEALASEVATLIAGLKAQITTLANTVAKIAKRVRA